MDKEIFDAKRTCGLKHCEQWGKNLKLCEDCVKKILSDSETFNLLAMDGPTIRSEWGYNGVYSKHMNHFIAPHKTEDELQCNEESKSFKNPSPMYSQCYTKTAYIDLVAFKAVNSCFGEPMGDAIIAYAANYLRRCFDDNLYMVTRKGGDEFNVFYMSNPRCIELDKLDKERIDDDKFKDYVYTQAFVPFANQEIVLCVPNDKKSENYIALPAEVFNALTQEGAKSDYNKLSYNFGVIVKGVFLRFGIGSDPEDAYDKKDAKKCDFEEYFTERNRGEFTNQTCICLADRNTGEYEWITLYNHLIFVTPDRNILKTLITAIGKFFQGKEGVAIIDKEYINCCGYNIPDVFFAVAEFDPDFSDENGKKLYERERLLKEVCKYIFDDLKEIHSTRGISKTFTLSNMSVKKICEKLSDKK